MPPFIDASIRREPDFEHSEPVITCLCRGGRFAPRLRVGDRVVYLTVKSAGPQRLVAVLAVDRLFGSHDEAASWFRERGKPLPVNLLVPGNHAKPIEQSDRAPLESRSTKPAGCVVCQSDKRPRKWGNECGPSEHAQWDAAYHERMSENPCVAGCSVVYCNPHVSAPFVTDDDLRAVFGKVPQTRNPGRQDITLLPRLLERVGVDVRLSSP